MSKKTANRPPFKLWRKKHRARKAALKVRFAEQNKTYYAT